MTSSKESLERLNNTIIEQLQRAHKAQIESLETELAQLKEKLIKFETIADKEITTLKNALEFECGDRCNAENNPCNAREVLNSLNYEKWKGKG